MNMNSAALAPQLQSFRCYIVDDHPLMRDGLRISINSVSNQHQIVGEAGDFDSALEGILQSDANIIILDHSLRAKTGLELIAKLRPQRPDLKYLLVSQCEDASVLEQYRELQIHGMISKLNSNMDMMTALEAISQGRQYICPSVQQILDAPRPAALLTQREIDVIKLMIQGKTNKEIGLELSCSDQTVKTHKANLMRKLNLSSSVEVSVWAIKNGLL